MTWSGYKMVMFSQWKEHLLPFVSTAALGFAQDEKWGRECSDKVIGGRAEIRVNPST